MEYTFLSLLPARATISINEVCKRIQDIGARHWVLSSDSFFQWSAPPSEMMRMFVATLLDAGMTADELDLMVRKNPSELLNA